jgi:outer membrane protein OmpA-like peptidoglycan-associated protein
MGDTVALKLSPIYDSAPLASGAQGLASIKITYLPKGTQGWAGVYWLSPANNWGSVKGAGFDFSKAKRLTFWVRGNKGGERIAEVKIGGISSGAYPDSDQVSLGPLKLSTTWDQYTMNLEGKDLRHIIGGFSFVVRLSDNPRGAVFFIDEIVFSGDREDGTPLPTPTPSPTPRDRFSVSRSSASYQFTYELGVATPLIKESIPYESAKTAFSDQTINILKDIIRLAEQRPKSYVVIAGHTDNVGPADVNKGISQERAKAVADYLQANGLNTGRMAIVGYGADRPLAVDSNKTENGRRANRRVEVLLYEDQ